MKRNRILILVIAVILIVTTSVSLVRWLSVGHEQKNGLSEDVTTVTNRPMPINEQGQPLYMIDGKIENIIDRNPFKMTIGVRLTHIFSKPEQEEMTKTVIVQKDTTFSLNNLITKEQSALDSGLLQEGDDVLVWTIEPNSDILSVEQFTATKIVKNQ